MQSMIVFIIIKSHCLHFNLKSADDPPVQNLNSRALKKSHLNVMKRDERS